MQQALPFFNEATAGLKAELDKAIQAAVACMRIDTQDNITDVNVGQNTAIFAERLASADYKIYSQADQEQKKCLNANGCASGLLHTSNEYVWLAVFSIFWSCPHPLGGLIDVQSSN